MEERFEWIGGITNGEILIRDNLKNTTAYYEIEDLVKLLNRLHNGNKISFNIVSKDEI